MFALALTLCLSRVAEPLPVPADALAVIQVRGLNHVRTQLVGLAAAIAPHKANDIESKLDALFRPDGRDLFALDVTRRSYLAVLGGDSSEVAWAVWLPVADYDRFRTSLLSPAERAKLRVTSIGEVTELAGQPLHLLDRTTAGYVVLTPSATAARRLAVGTQPLTVNKLGEAADVFLSSDIGLFVNLPAVHARYGGLLSGTRHMLPALLRGGLFGLPKLDARQAGQITAVAEGVIQAVTDGSGFAVGVSLGPTGITVEAALAVRSDTLMAKMLEGERPHQLHLIDLLPSGHAAYASGHFGAELTKRFARAFPEVVGGEPYHCEGGWATVGISPGPVLELCRTARPDRWLDSLRATYGRAGPGTAVQNVPLKTRPVLHRHADSHHGRVFDRLGVVFDLSAATSAFADEGVRQAAHTTIRALVGERADQWLCADDGQVLRVTAVDWTAARGLLDDFDGGGVKARDDAAMRTIRRRLPSDVSAMVLLDAAAVTCRVGGIVRDAVNELPAFPGLELPEFVAPRSRTPFLGLAVVAKPGRVYATLVLPADALQAAISCVRNTE